MRHTTFRLALAPTPPQAALLARHAGASRFAYNQCLRLVTDALAAQKTDPRARVPWSGFDLINAFNAWKVSEAAGRVFVVTPDGTVTKQVTGLGWRHEVMRKYSKGPQPTLVGRLPPTLEPSAARARAGLGFQDASARATAATASGCAARRAAAPPPASGSVKGTSGR